MLPRACMVHKPRVDQVSSLPSVSICSRSLRQRKRKIVACRTCRGTSCLTLAPCSRFRPQPAACSSILLRENQADEVQEVHVPARLARLRACWACCASHLPAAQIAQPYVIHVTPPAPAPPSSVPAASSAAPISASGEFSLSLSLTIITSG